MKNKVITYLAIIFPFFGMVELGAQEMPDAQVLIELQQLSQQILKSEIDEEKEQFNNEFKTKLHLLLSNSTYSSYPFDELKSIARLTSSDKLVRIFNWHIPYSDGTFSYHAFVLKKNKAKNTVDVFELTDNKETLENIENLTLKKSHWLGAHYYEIIDIKKGKQTLYTILGWDGNNLLTNRKIIEIIHFNSDNELMFGAPIFKSKQKTQKRYIFEYADEANFTLKYNEKEKCIIFDHLSPLSNTLKNAKAYYVPDGSFDAFKLEKGKWNFISNYDARLEKNIKDKFYNFEK